MKKHRTQWKIGERNYKKSPIRLECFTKALKRQKKKIGTKKVLKINAGHYFQQFLPICYV